MTPLQLATAYSTIASGGVLHKPYLISRVENYQGRVIEEVKVVSYIHIFYHMYIEINIFSSWQGCSTLPVLLLYLIKLLAVAS